MIKRNLIIYVVSLLIIFGCNHNRTSEDTPSLLSVEMKGVSQDEIIRSLVEQTKEFDYCDKERHEIKRVMFCGVPCGLNFEHEEENGAPTVTSVVLFTSHQDKATFDTFKNSISKKYGNPDLEKYEGGTEEIGGRYYGKCRWNNGEILLRNAQSDEGGLFVFLYPTVNKDHLLGKNKVNKTDSFVKTTFTWEDSRGNMFPVYMTSKGSCFIIRTSKSGENYRGYLGEEVSEQILKELSNRKSNDAVEQDTIYSLLGIPNNKVYEQITAIAAQDKMLMYSDSIIQIGDVRCYDTRKDRYCYAS